MNNYRADIQGLRALAVLMVVFYHAGLKHFSGYLGVDMFFVISGYVITNLLLKDFEVSNKFHFLKFYLRRFKRLMPSLALTIIITILFGFFIVPLKEIPVLLSTATGGMLLVSNFVIFNNTSDYFSPDANWNPLLHIWSLSVEEQFYLFFPILLTLSGLFRLHHKKRFQLSILLVLTISLFCCFYGPNLNSLFFNYYSPLLRAWEFAVGSILVFLPQFKSHISQNLLLSFGTLLIILSLIVEHSKPIDYNNVLIVLGTAILIKLGASNKKRKSILEFNLFQWIGDRSYSWYLWHWPFICFTKFLWPDQTSALVGAVILSIFVSAFTYSKFENPIRKSDIKSMKIWVILITITLVTPIATSEVLSKIYYPKLQSKIFQTNISSADLIRVGNCLNDKPMDKRDNSECLFGLEYKGNTPIYLIGDSNAASLAPALLLNLENIRRPMTVGFQGGGAFVANNRISNSTDPLWAKRVLNFSQGTMRWILAQKPGDIYLAFSDHYWTEDVLRYDGKELSKLDWATIYFEERKRQINKLSQLGFRVKIVGSIPHWPIHERTSLDWISNNLLPTKLSSGVSLPLVNILNKNADLRASDRRLEDLGAQYIDLYKYFCDRSFCYSKYKNMNLYSDVYHISTPYAEKLANIFLAFM